MATVVEPIAIVRSLAGRVVAEVSPVPETVHALKVILDEQLGTPAALQRLLHKDASHIAADDDELSPDGGEFVMLVDETPMYTWDYVGNPDRDQLVIEGSDVKCPELRTDYVNVLTAEPIRRGVHYFEFHMHSIGDEQWCGLVADAAQAGRRISGRSLAGCFYYAGRMRSNSQWMVDGSAALHAVGTAAARFKKPRPSGDVIGMLVDMGLGAVAFDLNGELQGACAVPTDKPLWVLTHVDTPRDHVELRKPSLTDAPPANLEALKGALLEIKGESLSSYPFGGWMATPIADSSDDDIDSCSAGEDACDTCSE